MRRFPLIIALLALCAPARSGVGGDLAPRLTVTAEYRQDALDYDNAEKRFFRESVRLTFGKSSVCITHVNVGMTRDNRFTWNICLRGFSPHVETIIGNYYAHFGTGLLVGRKMALSQDPFARSLAVSRGNPFAPCSTGNPYFSFQGLVIGALLSSENIALSLHGYYSFRNRFVRNDRQFPDITGSSLGAILIRTKKDYRYSDPVEINDSGYCLTMRIARLVTFQSYFIYTFIKRSNSHYLFWNFDTAPVPGGEKNFCGYGFYIQYRDDYMLLFIDLCFPNRLFSAVGGRSRTVRGFGIIYSLAFRHRACTLSFMGKQTDRNFYSPYSSGSGTPETAFTAAFSLRPCKNLTMGASFFTDKNRIPSGNEQYLRFTRRERVFLKYDAPLKGSCSIRLAFIEENTKKGRERNLKLSSASRIFIMKSILFTLNGAIQRRAGGGYSGSVGAATRFTLFNCLSVQLRYSCFFITRGATLHTSAARKGDSISRTMAVAASSSILAGGIRARFSGCRFSVDYLHHFSRRGTIQGRIEASGALLF